MKFCKLSWGVPCSPCSGHEAQMEEHTADNRAVVSSNLTMPIIGRVTQRQSVWSTPRWSVVRVHPRSLTLIGELAYHTSLSRKSIRIDTGIGG